MNLRWFSRLVLAASAASGVLAQTQFDVGTVKRHLPTPAGQDSAVAIGDVNGDGYQDLVLGRANYGGTQLYLGDGQGRFVPSTGLGTARDDTRCVALVDVDGDNDLDLLLGNFGRRNQLYLNDGLGRFTDVTTTRLPTDSAITWDFAAADVDGDGDTDLFVANGGPWNARQSFLYLNDGTGRFSDATSSRLPVASLATTAAAFVDVDRDGDMDLVLVNSNAAMSQPQTNRLYLNDGHGWFTDATATRFPSLGVYGNSVAVGDVDGDGDLDLVFGNGASKAWGRQTTLYLNDGAGVFSDGTNRLPVDADRTYAALADVDGDHDLDIVCVSAGTCSRLYRNDGTGWFVAAPAGTLPATMTEVLDVVVGDVDGDARPDVIAAGSPSLLWLNDGAGGLRDATQPRAPISDLGSAVVRPGDVDGDGALDLVVVGADRLWLLRGDGRGRFLDQSTALPAATGDFRDATLVDVDRDGDLDLVVAVWAAPNRLYRNEGGWFSDVTATQLPPDTDQTACVLAVDVDGDQHPDLLFGNCGQDRLYRNLGDGRFVDVTASHLPVDTNCTMQIVAGDVDLDSDMDLVVGATPNRLYLNDGHGHFTDATAGRLPGTNYAIRSMVLVDLDRDQDLDLVVLNDGCWPYGEDPDQVYRNDGTGTFQLTTVTIHGNAAVAAGDLDGDGDPDLLTASACSFTSSLGVELFLNDGSGQLSAAPARLPSVGGVTQLALADSDGDGDLDVPGLSLVNRVRQLESPYLLRLGRAGAFDLLAEPGYATVTRVALLALAPGPGHIPLPPLGTFGLDLSRTVFLPPVMLAASGQARIGFTVPADPLLLGLDLHAQALIVDLALQGGFTNVVVDPVGR